MRRARPLAHPRLGTPTCALPLAALPLAALPLAHSHLRTPTCGTPACALPLANSHLRHSRLHASCGAAFARSRSDYHPRARSVRRTAQLRTHVLGRRAARRGVEVLDGHACRAANGRTLDCGALAFLGTSCWGDDAMRAERQPNQLRAMAIHDNRPPVPGGLAGHRDGAGLSTAALSAA